MTLLPAHNYFIFNDQIIPVSAFADTENSGGIYEVIRVDRGIPLFIDDHLARLFNSAVIAGETVLYTKSKIKSLLKLLIHKNKIDEGNILVSSDINLKLFFIAHKYPSPEMYEKGVVCGILDAERDNPNAKILQTSIRQSANRLIEENNFYEILLVNKRGRITEGSRSNVFFVKENKIITPPGNGVLLGITRQKTIQLIQSLGVDFVEREVLLNELTRLNGLFITGTSPKILPIKRVNNYSFNPKNRLVQTLISHYNLMVDEYVEKSLLK